MAATLPSPPLSRSSSPQPSAADYLPNDELAQRLDVLLEHYLNLLDQYSKLRDQLTKDFSNGFLSLAQAQRASNLGPGRRYGQDGYDNRMKALRRVSISSEHDEDSHNLDTLKTDEIVNDPRQSTYRFRVVDIATNPARLQEDDVKKSDSKEEQMAVSKIEHQDDVKPQQLEKEVKRKLKSALANPITWYGVLVPQPLRQTQASFATCVGDSIPHLLSVISAMEALEQEVWHVRRKLALKEEDYSNRPDQQVALRRDVGRVDSLPSASTK